MIYTIKSKVQSLFSGTNDRSKNVIKNIVMSFGVRLGSISVGLLLVPMTIKYISPLHYGIWLTISSVVSWMSFFDIGLGNGLRNKLATSLAKGDFREAKQYVSTTYAVLSIISIILFLLILILSPLVNWKEFLNIPSSVKDDIQFVVLIVLVSFCAQFIVQTLNTVLTASHEPAKAAFLSFLGQVGILVAVFILKLYVPGSLTILVIVLTSIPVLILLIASLVLYSSKLRHLSPSFKLIDFTYAGRILNVGGAFFIIQIGALVLFQTGNIIITKVIGPAAVTEFNVAYKLFSIVTMISTIIVTPYWSAFTDAVAKGDYAWMRNNMKAIRKIWMILSIVAVFLFFISGFIYKVWVGESVVVNRNLSFAMMVYVICSMWQTVHVFFLNGIGKVRLQLYCVVISAIVNIPLAIFLGKTFGLAGIISANTIVFIVMGIMFSIQVEKILSHKAKGIWAR